MKIDVKNLMKADSALSTVSYLLPLHPDKADKRSFFYGVTLPSPMKVDCRISGNAGYLTLFLTLSLDYIAPCSRCLTETKGTFVYELEQPIGTAAQIEELDIELRDDYVVIDEDGFVDLDEELSEIIEMQFPCVILCKEDCKGLCQRCGTNLNIAECECDKGRSVDPRMQGLQAILERMQKEEEDT